MDLAGSERQRSSGSEADRLKEGTAINLSLTTLGNVIRLAACVSVAFQSQSVWFISSCHITPLLQLPRRCGRGEEGRPYTLQGLGSHQVAAVCTGRQQSHCYGNRVELTGASAALCSFTANIQIIKATSDSGHQLIFKIATLSPADICYEESLSTLRYAERYNKPITGRPPP